jgi:hypothetical protein
VLIGPQIRFLDLTPRAAEVPDAAAVEAVAPAAEPTAEAEPAAGTPPEPRVDAGFFDDL